LDEDAEEALHRAEQRAMDHEWLMASAIFAHVLKAETRGEIEIELHRGELPWTANGIDQFHVDFRTVESSFPGYSFEGDLHSLHRFGKCGAGVVPILGFANVIFWMRSVPVGQFDLELVEAEVLHHRKGEIHAGLDFAFDLRRHAENVRIVL